MRDIQVTRIESTEEIVDSRTMSMAELQKFLAPKDDISTIDASRVEYEYSSKVDIFNIQVKKSLR
jgi:hypothetical protein